MNFFLFIYFLQVQIYGGQFQSNAAAERSLQLILLLEECCDTNSSLLFSWLAIRTFFIVG